MTKHTYRTASRAVAAHMLRWRFSSVDLESGFVATTDLDPAAGRLPRELAQDEDTILTVGTLVAGEGIDASTDEWARARAARLARRHDFMPMVDEVAAALESRGSLTFGHIDDLVRSVRRRLDIQAMEDHPLVAI